MYGNRLAVLRFEYEAAASFIPVDQIVRFSRRIRHPLCRLFGYSCTHVETEFDLPRLVGEVLDANGFSDGTTFRGHEHFGREFQSIGLGFTHDPMGVPCIGDFITAVRIRNEDAAIQEQFTGKEKAGTPGGVGNSATAERRQ